MQHVNRRSTRPGARIRAVALLVALALATRASAEVDLTLRREGDPDTWIRPTLRLDAAFFAESNAWAGNARRLIGDQTHGWGEFGVTPGLDGELSLGDAGTLRARVSGVYTTTQLGLDAAGSNLDDRHPHEVTLEDAYVGWKSGDLFPSLGEDAIDLSVGSQPYELGSGFLFQDGGTDGGRRGGYWLGLRKAFRLTAVARLETGPFLAEGMYLRPNDRPDTSTDVAGLNLEWTFGERAAIGAGYWNVFDSDDERRDGLQVFDLRFDASPLKDRDVLPGLRLSGEVAHERNGSRNDSWGAYAEVGYAFEQAPWKPTLSYRYAYFTGDDSRGKNTAFDPLFYGFQDWGTWYLGEIVGEYVASNSNARVHTLRVRAEPTDALTADLLYFFFRLDELPDRIVPRPPTQPRAALIRDRNLAHAVDVALAWQVCDLLSLSAVAGVLVLEPGGEDFFADDDVWSHYMLVLTVAF
jgi:hypothetical protein